MNSALNRSILMQYTLYEMMGAVNMVFCLINLIKSFEHSDRSNSFLHFNIFCRVKALSFLFAFLGMLSLNPQNGIEAQEYPETLTNQEIEWLQSISDTPIRYVIPPKFIPVSFIKDGAADGIVKAYIQILEKRLGLTLRLLDVPFKEGVELAKKGEVDLFPCLAQRKDREAFLTFIQDPYLAFQLVIVTRKDGEPIHRIQDLDGKRVAVDKTQVAYSKLKNEHSDLNIEFVFVQTNPNAIKAVHLSEADAALTSAAVGGFLIAENGWNNLKIAANSGWPEVRMKMGVKKEWPLMVSILEKTLAEIPESTRLEISNSWIPVHIEHGFDSAYVLKRILPIIGGFAAIALVVSLFLMMMIKKNRQLHEAEQKIQKAYVEVETAMKVAEKASKAKGEFLDNSGQGFLSFGEDLIVDPEMSRECEAIFEKPASGINICDLLFLDGENDATAKALLEKTVRLAINEPLDLKQELYLSILKPCYLIGNKHVKAEYQIIDGPKIMMILTDLSREKQLEKDVETERQRLKFVVAAVRDSQDFFAIIDEYRQFKSRKLPELFNGFIEQSDSHGNPSIDNKPLISDIYRPVHTFKGLFAQQDFIALPKFLHTMESRLSEMLMMNAPPQEAIELFVMEFQKERALDQDLSVIREILGDAFMTHHKQISIGRDHAMKMEQMARKLLMSEGAITLPGEAPPWDSLNGDAGLSVGNVLQHLLTAVSRIRYVTLKSLLDGHVDGILRYARRAGKQITPFQVEGEAVRVDPERFTPLTRSLVNVFRNALDHGIETPEERISAGKSESATIRCDVRSVEGPLEAVEIRITDDGRGIDFYAIEGRAVQKNLMTLHEVKQASDEALINLIFSSGFSTSKAVGALSGRGVGLNAVKHEVERLNGQIEIKTEIDKGTQFIFRIPL